MQAKKIDPNIKPSLKDLGYDLLRLSPFQLGMTLAIPFVFFGLYFVFAFNGIWGAAVFCTMGLSFATYGSTSHDLVHENLRLSRTTNSILLAFLELICFRSGHAYRLSHLHHHNRYPHSDDVEGAASSMSFVRALLEGIIFQAKIYKWALTRHKSHKDNKIVVIEGVGILMLMAFCLYSIKFTSVFLVYMFLMIAGSWIIPLITSYFVHTPDGDGELNQTRLFRGTFFSLIAFDHLFHLEHHLYPMVPHKNWPKLAKRLDHYFQEQGVKPMQVKI